MPETWTPKLAVLSARAIPVNLLDYITNEERLQAVLEWAGDGNLKLLKTRRQRLQNKKLPQYPSIEFSDDNDAKKYASDIIGGAYSLVLETAVRSNDMDEAIRQARIYSTAVESMIVNIPRETLLTGTGAFAAVHDSIETGFEKLKKHTDRENDFLQVFQTRATWQLQAGFKS
jgi:hypothetical protein